MAAAGCQLLYPLCKHSVMWILHVVKQIFTFIRLLKKAQQFFREQRPDVVVVIDYPGLPLEAGATSARRKVFRSSTLSRRKSGRGPSGVSKRCGG